LRTRGDRAARGFPLERESSLRVSVEKGEKKLNKTS